MKTLEDKLKQLLRHGDTNKVMTLVAKLANDERAVILYWAVEEAGYNAIDTITHLVKKAHHSLNDVSQHYDESVLARALRNIPRAKEEKLCKLVDALIGLGAVVTSSELIVAIAESCSTAMLKTLIRLCSDTNEMYNNMCPIHKACTRDRLEVVKLLVENGSCDVTARNAGGETPLGICMDLSHFQIANYLLDHGGGAAPSAKHLTDNLSLAISVAEQQKEIFDKVLLHHSDVNACRNFYVSLPLGLAAWYGQLYAVERLLSHAKTIPQMVDNRGRNALQAVLLDTYVPAYRRTEIEVYKSVLRTRIKIVRALVLAGVPLHVSQFQRRLDHKADELEPLTLAMKCMDPSFVACLLHAGADPQRVRVPDVDEAEAAEKARDLLGHRFGSAPHPDAVTYIREWMQSFRSLQELCRIKFIQTLHRWGHRYKVYLQSLGIPPGIRAYITKL